MHSTQQTVDVLLLQSSNEQVSMSMHALTERSSYSWHQRGMQRHCITVCKLALCIMFFTVGSLLAFLKFVESVNCSYFFPTLFKSHFEASSVACILVVYVIHVSHTALFNSMYYSNCIYNTSS